MRDFGGIINVPLRNIWQHEAHDFKPWLASNILSIENNAGFVIWVADIIRSEHRQSLRQNVFKCLAERTSKCT